MSGERFEYICSEICHPFNGEFDINTNWKYIAIPAITTDRTTAKMLNLSFTYILLVAAGAFSGVDAAGCPGVNQAALNLVEGFEGFVSSPSKCGSDVFSQLPTNKNVRTRSNWASNRRIRPLV